MPKRVFAFRYIESLGLKIMVVQRTSLLKLFACPTKQIGCPGPSESRNFRGLPTKGWQWVSSLLSSEHSFTIRLLPYNQK